MRSVALGDDQPTRADGAPGANGDRTVPSPPAAVTEVEWQFDALDVRPVERWLHELPSRAGQIAPELGAVTVEALPEVDQQDHYLDTADWRIGRAGYALRTRADGNAEHATLKALDPGGAKNEPRRRREFSEAIAGSGLEWLAHGGPVGARVSAIIGRHPLVPVLEVRTHRRPFELRFDGDPAAELALDDTTIALGSDQPPARLRRVEVEVRAPWEHHLRPLVEDLRRTCVLWPAKLSKYEAGLLAKGEPIRHDVDLGPTAITPDSTIGELANAVIRRHLGALLAKEPGARLGEDPEELHDMRVATRRLRAAFALFSDLLPAQFAVLRGELAWLADALGTVRDLDVQIAELESARHWVDGLAGIAKEGAPVDHLIRLLEAERDRARQTLLRTLDSDRYERLTTGLSALAQSGAARRFDRAHAPSLAVLPDLVTARHRSAVKAARLARRSGAPSDFHRLRIRCKRLRYALEPAVDLYGLPAQQFVRKLASLQDQLGHLQDATVAIARLFTLASEGHDHLPPETIFTMGALAERYQLRADQALQRLPRRTKVLQGARWRVLADLMGRQRPGSSGVAG